MVAVSIPIDHARFAELAGPLIGLTVTAPWLGDYTALYLEIGPLTDSYPSGRPKAQYSAYFGFDWTLESRLGQELSSTHASAATQIINALAGQQVTGVEVTSSWEFVLALGSEQHLRSLTTNEQRHEWTLFLPSGSWLAVEANSLVLEEQSPRLSQRA
jgi:hypothetical protein